MNKTINAKFLLIAMAIAVVFTLSLNIKAQSDKMPAPNFSEMEKDYEIIKWSYEDSGYIRLVIRTKHDPPQEHKYGFWFFDEDGAAVSSFNTIFNSGYSTPAGTVEKGEAYAPDEAKMRKVKTVIVYRFLSDNTIIGPKPEEAKKNSTSNNSAGPKNSDQTESKISASENNKFAAGCNYDEPPSTSSFPGFSAELAKSGIYERYGFEKDTGGISSPADVGVTFLDIKLLGSYKNTVTVVPGRGAQRKHDGAPVGATVYRFHARYIVCRKYSDSTRRTQYDSDNVCFKDKNGGWNCPVDSVPQITELN